MNAEAKKLYDRGLQLIDQGKLLMERAVEIGDDELLNRTQALDYLPWDSFRSLKTWENRIRPYGYLQFRDNKIKRSEIQKFIRDWDSGRIHRILAKKEAV